MAQAPRRPRSVTANRPGLTLLLGLCLGYGIYLSQLGLRRSVALIGLLPPATALGLWARQSRQRRDLPLAGRNLLDPSVFSDQVRRIGRGSARSRSGGLSWRSVADRLEAIQDLALQSVELDDSCEVEMRVALHQLLELAEAIAAGLQIGRAHV